MPLEPRAISGIYRRYDRRLRCRLHQSQGMSAMLKRRRFK